MRVRVGEVTRADVVVPPRDVAAVNILAMGIAEREGVPIVLGPSGVRVTRGTSAMIGVTGPGMEEGTAFAVIGLGLSVRIIRFAMTQGGTQGPQPAAVLSLVVPPDAAPGLYSLIAVRGREYSVFPGGLEVL